jgi:hypothetical protein
VLETELLVATPDTGLPSGHRVLTGDEDLEFILVTDDEGLTVLPAFTSEEALLRWKPQGSPFLGLPGRVLIEALATNDWHRIVIDGNSPEAFAITRSQAQELLGVTPIGLDAGTAVRVGQPVTPPPKGLRQALRRAFERHPRIASAYLFQIQIVEAGEAPHLAVGLELDRPLGEIEFTRTVNAINDDVDPAVWGYDFLDYVVLSDDLRKLGASDDPPIYERSG